LFEILWTEAALLLPAAFQQRYHQAEDETEARRVVCDYIAGMTDNYANRMYERLLEPGKGSVFDRL
jgi:dGTPase